MKLKHTIQLAALFVAGTLSMGANCDKLQQSAGTLNRGGGASNTIGDLVTIGTGDSRAGQITEGAVEAGAAQAMSREREEAIGESLAISLTNSPGLVKDDKLADYVIKVGLTVASACPRDDITFTFGVLDTDQVNAYSAPHGYVFVTRGAIARMQDESELAGVIGHEIGHIVKNHGIEIVKGKAGTAGLAKMAKAATGDQLSALLADTTKTLLNTTWDQSQEFAADAEAITYVKAAGYDPRGYARFLSRVEGGGLFSTHPKSADRVARVNKAIGTTPTGVTLAERFKAATTK